MSCREAAVGDGRSRNTVASHSLTNTLKYLISSHLHLIDKTQESSSSSSSSTVLPFHLERIERIRSKDYAMRTLYDAHHCNGQYTANNNTAHNSHTHTHTQPQLSTYTRTRVCVYICGACVRVCVCVCICTYTDTYRYIYVCVINLPRHVCASYLSIYLSIDR